MQLQLSDIQLDSTQIKLLNSAGQSVVAKSFLPDATLSSLKIELPALPAGIYFLVIYQQKQPWAAAQVWIQQ
ncbi:MAG: T9SS type A sorting domain-containing protein [Saprospiraceae bacterium]